MIKPRNRKF